MNKISKNNHFTKETERLRMIAGVKVWRAWYHIQLLLWYGRNDGIPIVEKALAATEIYQPHNTVQECLDFINKELAFEGKRYHDIRRWGIDDKTMKGSTYGAWNPNSSSFVTFESRNCTFPKNDSWPLPQAEVTSNQQIKQPAGW